MGSSGYTKLKVGFTILFALVILIGGFLWVKNYNPMVKKVNASVVFDNGRGITGGDPVLMSGVRIGEVTGVKLSPDNRALITYYINYVKLGADTKFVIEDVGLMGDKALVIKPGTQNAELDFQKVQEGSNFVGLDSMIEGANKTITLLNNVIADIDSGLDIKAIASELQNTIVELRKTSVDFRNLAGDARRPILNSVNNVESLSSDMKKFMGRNESRIDDTIFSFQQSSGKISSLVDRMENLSVVIDTLATYMNRNDGSLSKLLKDDSLYEELRNTNADIDSFVKDFKKRPGKYTKDMNFKIRLF
jgi:phospholipid/cholesterol/gamma-HCH transport system substrate-binding protein